MPYRWRGEEFLVKRDDLISSYLSGNKAYKAYFLLHRDFSHIVSYGGNQSNAMLSLAYIARLKGAKFTYFTTPLSSYLKNNIEGNLKLALEFGMEIRFSKALREDSSLFAKEINALYIPQGIACIEARDGIERLAEEILELGLDNLCVICSSGTGTMSFYLQKCLRDIRVFSTPCVGSAAYLYKQFVALMRLESNLDSINDMVESNKVVESKRELDSTKEANLKEKGEIASGLDSIKIDDFTMPYILQTKQKYTFAKPYKELLEIYKEHLEGGLEFDLLYDCLMWRAVWENIELIKSYKHCLFLHSGGIYGNQTQLKRYARI